ncbi:MAG: 1-deoxy-D-xylulose-5-phosphate reductoisomerase [Chitinophagaceae bacterium]|nr:1-deoxy-D-xylulose-5-phosphate reductoisomerase [Chitinophagaceae bacterium]
MKQIAVYGSTGSIGTQTLAVIRENPTLFKAAVLTAGRNADLLVQQALEFKPSTVVVVDEKAYNQVKQALAGTSIQVLCGEQALVDVATAGNYDMLMAAIVGYAGLLSTIAGIKAGKAIALANKETLVVAGQLVMDLVKEYNTALIPVDSEHSAIFQCLVGEAPNSIDKIILTASGGPFLGKKTNFLVNVKKDHALQHPNWTMGAKITIDSASLMNKGLEMIEAKWLFGLRNNQIEVVIHPQSIIHSMVEFNDSSVKAQMGLPDMKLPIHYAMTYPNRLTSTFKRLDFKYASTLTFEPPDVKTFRNLQLAREAMERGGNAPCILNAANEVVVDAFLRNKIGFLEMSDVIADCLEKMDFIETPGIDDHIHTNTETRRMATLMIK